VFRVKNVKDIVPKLNFCIKKSMAKLDSFAKTGEDVRQSSFANRSNAFSTNEVEYLLPLLMDMTRLGLGLY
jgi:hypothetical protein